MAPTDLVVSGPGTGAAVESAESATTPADVRRLFASFLAAKSAASVDRIMAFFSPTDTTYRDGTAGFAIPDWAAVKGLFEQFVPQWGPRRDRLGSYGE